MSFRLDPGFLPDVEYPMKPHGLFFVIGTWPLVTGADIRILTDSLGNEFRGFHIRFRDVARGGIRIVRSRNKE